MSKIDPHYRNILPHLCQHPNMQPYYNLSDTDTLCRCPDCNAWVMVRNGERALELAEPCRSDRVLIGSYCRDCRWWETAPLLRAVGITGLCMLTAYDPDNGGLMHPETLARVSGYDRHVLFTEPRYGCVQGRAREQDEAPAR